MLGDIPRMLDVLCYVDVAKMPFSRNSYRSLKKISITSSLIGLKSDGFERLPSWQIPAATFS